MNYQEPSFDQFAMTCKAALGEILVIWPKPDRSEPADFRSRLAPYLSTDFNDTDLLNRIVGVRAWEQVKAAAHEVILDFADTANYPQRAIFIGHPGRGWLLKSLKFQCSCCFGTGRNNGKECTICGGLGWGAA